mmetsp:Transcript_21487/g.53457  ORF Transcript_21487/g.53457 Transcript_21487/m.53457 type:complete len:221 (+) Transcript_21487:549-1211(+)
MFAWIPVGVWLSAIHFVEQHIVPPSGEGDDARTRRMKCAWCAIARWPGLRRWLRRGCWLRRWSRKPCGSSGTPTPTPRCALTSTLPGSVASTSCRRPARPMMPGPGGWTRCARPRQLRKGCSSSTCAPTPRCTLTSTLPALCTSTSCRRQARPTTPGPGEWTRLFGEASFPRERCGIVIVLHGHTYTTTSMARTKNNRLKMTLSLHRQGTPRQQAARNKI